MSPNEPEPPQKIWVCDNCEGAPACELRRADINFTPRFCVGDAADAIWHSQCRFERDWAGQCTKNAVKGSLYCEEHAKAKCISCGAPATHSCDHTGQFVCGHPLCDDCVGIEMNNRHVHTKKGGYYHGPFNGGNYDDR